MKMSFSLILTLVIVLYNCSAKHHVANYLADMSIKGFRISATLKEVKENNHLYFISNIYDEQSYLTNKKTGGFLGKTIFNNAILNFRDGYLTRICFTKSGDLNNGNYLNEYNLLTSFYGVPQSFVIGDSAYKRYEWHEGDIDLILQPSEHSFSLFFGKKPISKT